MNCNYCEEPLEPGDTIVTPDMHAECAFRATSGSVAHQQGRCSCFVAGSTEGDPPGMTPREAARAAVGVFLAKQKRQLRLVN